MVGALFIIISTALWALDTLIRYPLVNSGFNSIKLVLLEHIILCLILGVLFFKPLLNLRKLSLKNMFSFIMIGGFGSAIATISFTQAFNYLNPSLVIVLQKLQPIIAILFARIFLKEVITKQFILLAILCLFGSFLISIDDLLKVFEAGNNLVYAENGVILGFGLVLISVFGWGLATVFGKELRNKGFSEQELLLGRFFIGLIFSIPFFIIMSEDLSLTTSVEDLSKISLMVLISGILAMYLYYKGLNLVTAKNCTLLELFFPFFAILLNWVFLDKTLNTVQLMGAGILTIGAALIQLKRP
ncbi:DMT family transporter [Bacteriovoracaceae bacterium]|nr:DMT family transporter [Bacteriovoracaceae bacterium]